MYICICIYPIISVCVKKPRKQNIFSFHELESDFKFFLYLLSMAPKQPPALGKFATKCGAVRMKVRMSDG